MATAPSPATRTNRVLATLVALVLIGAGVSAATGKRTETSSSSTTTPTDTLPTDIGNIGLRPAETSYTWFNHGFGTEQFDYKMSTLSCQSVQRVITTDLCGVVGEGKNAFMLVGAEGYWDPQEKDANGSVWVPLNLTAFTLRTDRGTSRAVSVLDGYVEKEFTANKAQVDLWSATVGGHPLFILHKHLSSPKADPYALLDEVQIVALSSTGAPTVVGTYEGAALSVSASADRIEISSLRYLSTGGSQENTWHTRIALLPRQGDEKSSGFGFDEVVTSGPSEVAHGDGLTKLDSYSFPLGRGRVDEMPKA